MTDQIQSEIHIDAPVDEVWNVVTDPRHIGVWFAPFEAVDAASLDIRPNATMNLLLRGETTYPALIVDVDPPRLFSYRWAMIAPGEEPTDQNSTLVQFMMAPDGDGTLLRVVESGFSRLDMPADHHASAQNHAQGWPGIIEKVRTQVELIAVR
jgi:uncharacterized protein YndB with AHSA1/START domain